MYFEPSWLYTTYRRETLLTAQRKKLGESKFITMQSNVEVCDIYILTKVTLVGGSLVITCIWICKYYNGSIQDIDSAKS